MRLQRFLELHHACLATAPRAIAVALGDPILYVENAIFRGVRDRAIELGARYEIDGHPDYHCYPLASLPAILETGAIPVRPMLPTFERLERGRPGVLEIEELAPFVARKQAVFHESAHLIANRLTRAAFGATPEDARMRFFRCMLEEAFADAVEVTANALNRTDQAVAAHLLNSYMMNLSPRAHELLRESSEELGLRSVIKLFVAFFLRAHFFRRELSAEDAAAVLALCGLPSEGERASRREYLAGHLHGIAITFTSPQRYQIARTFFRIHGMTDSLEESTAFDPIAFWRDSPWSSLLDGLADAATGSRDGAQA